MNKNKVIKILYNNENNENEMKSDLIITRFKTEPIIGTKSTFDPKTFFGSKMIDIEDEIIIDDSKIQFSELYDNSGENTNTNGYQYYDDIDFLEKISLVELTETKNKFHNIILLSQSDIDLQNNTNWNILISWKEILSEYLFYRLKEARTFKAIKYTDVLSENINLYIKSYIKNNILTRYQFGELKMYVEYFILDDEDIEKEPMLLFNPKFTADVKKEENLISNVNATVFDTIINVNYKQTESTQTKIFNYYFDLVLTKI